MGSNDFDALIAGLVVKLLDELGVESFSYDEILTDESVRNRDLAELGLGSLDWIRLAVWIGNETGLELPQTALVQSGSRTVAGWTGALVLAAQSDQQENQAHATSRATTTEGESTSCR